MAGKIENPEKVYHCMSKMQAELMCAKLREAKIDCYTEGVGATEYMSSYAGFSAFGSNVYVDTKDVTAAKEVVEKEKAGISEESGEVEQELLKYYKRNQIMAGIGGAILILVLALVFFF